MKKLASIILALAMVMALSTTAFAVTMSTGEQDIDVQAKYQDDTTTGTVYSVDITWGAMKFTYTETGTVTWNPVDHSYSRETSGTWTPEGNTVTVTNHSNAEVTASFAFTALEDYNTVTGNFDVSSKELAAGVVGGYDSADKVAATLSLEGTLAESVADFTKIGAITVTIA